MMDEREQLERFLNELALNDGNFTQSCQTSTFINHTALTEELKIEGINDFFCISQFISPQRSIYDPYRNLIRIIKDKQDYKIGFLLGKLLSSAILSERNHWRDADAVIPVPSEPTRLIERGFSSSSILATSIASCLEIPLFANILTRTPCIERAINSSSKKIMTTFSSDWYRANLERKTVILVDDVLTTGETLKTCAIILRSLGIKKIFAATLAISGYKKEIEKVKPEILVVSGPSGSGKTTIINEIVKYDNFEHPVHYTTRKSRKGEVDGIDFNFSDKSSFQKMVFDNQMLAWTSFGSNYYGYSVNSVMKILSKGKRVVLNLEPFLALSLKLRWPSTILVFLQPPKFEDILERLKKRQPEEPNNWLEERIGKAKESMNYRDFFDFTIVSTDIFDTVSQIKNLLNNVYM